MSLLTPAQHVIARKEVTKQSICYASKHAVYLLFCKQIKGLHGKKDRAGTKGSHKLP